LRKCRDEGQDEREDAGRAQHVRAREHLCRQVDAERAVGGDARDHQPHRDRKQERRQRRHQRVADREERKRLQRFERTHRVVGAPDHDAADQVEDDDHERRDRIAFDELAGAVHRAVKIRLSLHDGAFAAGRFGVEHAGVDLGIDRHLLAGHRVEREARRNFRDALRTRSDNDELDRHQDREDDQPDDQVAAHDEGSEGRDDRADPAFEMALGEDQPRRRNVERQTKERRDQQRGSKRRELERFRDRDADEQHDPRAQDVDREQRVEQQRRQRNQQDCDDRKHDRGKAVGRGLGIQRIAPSRTSEATIAATAT
jgi:hypothetical protein